MNTIVRTSIPWSFQEYGDQPEGIPLLIDSLSDIELNANDISDLCDRCGLSGTMCSALVELIMYREVGSDNDLTDDEYDAAMEVGYAVEKG